MQKIKCHYFGCLYNYQVSEFSGSFYCYIHSFVLCKIKNKMYRAVLEMCKCDEIIFSPQRRLVSSDRDN